MKNTSNLQDKVNQATISPSINVWRKVEDGLDANRRRYRIRRNSFIGWAAAVLVIVLAYQAGRHEVNAPDYQPQTLQLYDQASKAVVPHDFYPLPNYETAYRKDGRLIPNAHTLWENPLVPRTVDF